MGDGASVQFQLSAPTGRNEAGLGGAAALPHYLAQHMTLLVDSLLQLWVVIPQPVVGAHAMPGLDLAPLQPVAVAYLLLQDVWLLQPALTPPSWQGK